MSSLLDAVLSVGRGLELPQALRRIVETAVELVDAEYGALGVADDEHLPEFLPVGPTREQYDSIGPLPAGHSLLGEVIRHPRGLHLHDLSRRTSPADFPAHRPPARPLLRVPITVRGGVFGTLFLARKRDGQDFDEDDESVLGALAVAAGAAIENARRYERARYRQSWLEADAEIVEELLSGAEEPQVLGLILRHARRILDADLGAVALPVRRTDTLHVALASGLDAEQHRGLVLPRAGSFVGSAIGARGPITSLDIEHDPRITEGPPRWAGLGPAVAVPMGAGDGVRGVVLLARVARRPAFTEAETEPLMAFAGQAALAMELAERRRSAEQLTLFEDRDRIARDLHDLAIQRLFATGMTLQSAVRFVDHPEANERLLRAVDDLDETIKIIRSTIFGLRSHGQRCASGLRARTVTVLNTAAAGLGFTPALRMEGLIDTDVTTPVADDVVAVLSESLTNVARHAHASTAEVSLVVRSGTLTLTVRDNGCGIGEGGRRSGLLNMAERAEKLGGEFTLDSGDAQGTRLTWRVPAMPD